MNGLVENLKIARDKADISAKENMKKNYVLFPI